MHIGQVSQISDQPTSTIRYYEHIELLPKPERKNGIRIYTESVLKILKIIDVSQKAGFSLDEIRLLLKGFEAKVKPAERWKKMAKQKMEELNSSIEKMIEMKKILNTALQCNCSDFDECEFNNDSHSCYKL